MATVIKDLGAVSAYAYAVEQGYTGTEEEYAEMMASYATVAESAAASATSANASRVAAKASEGNAAASEIAAGVSASSAAASATEASESATNAASAASSAVNAKTASETAQSKAEEAQEAAEQAASQLTNSDWNANVGEPGYILNRPFYEETAESVTTLFDGNAQFETESFGAISVFYGDEFDSEFHYPGTEGLSFSVLINGTEYIFDDNTPLLPLPFAPEYSYPRIGDIVFAADAVGGMSYMQIIDLGTVESFTASVKIVLTSTETTVTTINNKFLSPSIPKGISVDGDLQMDTDENGQVEISYSAPHPITSGTTVYEDGVTSLPTGQIYLQYEL